MKRLPIEKIEFQNASLGYNQEDSSTQDISIEIPMGKIYWLRGESGVGKSSLLRIFAGLQDPPTGTYRINDEPVSEKSFEEFLPYRINIGYGFDMGGLLNNKTIFENLMLPLEYHGEISREQAKELVDGYLKYFDIHHYRNIRPALLSGAIRKLVCILRAFVMKPQLILLDDATTGLSDSQLGKLRSWINEYKAENATATLILTAQDQRFISNLCDSVLWVKKVEGLIIEDNVERAA